MEYNYEEQRKNAFVICNNKIYKGEVHFDCYFKAIEDMVGVDEIDYNFEKYFNMEDSALSKLLGDVIIGEISVIEKKESIICYSKKSLVIIAKYFKCLPIYEYDGALLSKVS